MKNVSIYLESDSTAFQKKKRICGYVLEYIKKNGDAETREEFREAEGTYHREILQTLSEALGRIREPCTICIYSQDAFVCNMLTKKLSEWADNDFISNGKPVANREEWRTVWEQIKIHKTSTCIGKHSYTDWMLAEMEERFEKREKKQKSILQNQEHKQCYLCMLLEGNCGYQTVEDHHIFFGSNRRNSEIHGFKVNLCIRHHREGKEAVHRNRENDLLLKELCQKEYEKTHTRQEFVRIIGKSYLGGGFERA